MSPDRLNEIATQFNLGVRGDVCSITLTGEELVDMAELALDGLTLRQMEENDMNRDYFSKPIQTSRNMHSYGHTGPLSEPEAPNWGRAFLWAMPVALAFWGILWCLWVVLP